MAKYTLKLYIDLTEKREITEKEQVDFRKIYHIPNVIKDQLVAEILEGVSGSENFTFNSLEEIKKAFSSQFYFNPNEPNKVYAKISGKLYIENGKFYITDKMEVKNVDYSTGNIFFVGDLIVQNEIKSGFEVKARNIVVNGNINNAKVSAGEKIIVKGGVIGIQGKNECYLKAEKMIVANFIENTTIECEGSVFLKKSSMHTDIYSGDKIIVENPGYIIGGNILAKKSILAKVVGSKWGTKTILKVGIDPFKYLRLKSLLSKKKSREKLIEELEKSLNYLNEVLEKGRGTETEKKELEQEIKEIIEKKEKFSKNLERLDKLIGKLKDEIDKDNEIAHLMGGKIFIFEKIYPGVEIKVGLESLKINDEINGKYIICLEDEKITFKELTE